MKLEKQEYNGHIIELRKRDDKLELLIDNDPVRYGQLEGGLYFFHQYAYDWTDSLMNLAQRYIDYEHKADEIRYKNYSQNGGK
jgi:hypothetical protein